MTRARTLAVLAPRRRHPHRRPGERVVSALPEHVWLITVDGEWPGTVVADDGDPTYVASAWERRRASANVDRDSQVRLARPARGRPAGRVRPDDNGHRAARTGERVVSAADRYAVITAQVVGGGRHGFTIEYYWDARLHRTKDEAVAEGFTLGRGDDFNIGVVRNGRLVSLWWMDRQLDEPPATLHRIARQVGLT